MQLALLSDVHSNLPALEAVLEDIQATGPDATAFLGDAVGYNAHPQECSMLLAEHCQTSVLGNHDQAVLEGGEEWFNAAAREGIEHSRRELEEDALAYLSSMQEQTTVHETHLVHGSPRGPTTEYVFPDAPDRMLEKIANHPSVEGAPMLAMGHTHVPFKRRIDDTLVFNVGSVGQPRDGDPRSCWALVDTDARTVEHRRVEYDVDEAAKSVRKAGLPEPLARRLYEGR